MMVLVANGTDPRGSKYPIFKDFGPKTPFKAQFLEPEASNIGYLDPLVLNPPTSMFQYSQLWPYIPFKGALLREPIGLGPLGNGRDGPDPRGLRWPSPAHPVAGRAAAAAWIVLHRLQYTRHGHTPAAQLPIL